MPPRARRRPIKVVEKIVAADPEFEHSFIKKSRCSLADVTHNNTPTSTEISVEKSASYKIRNSTTHGIIYTMHTHPKTNKICVLPSVYDLIEAERPNVVYICIGKEIQGQVHFHLRKNAIKSFEKFKLTSLNTRSKFSKLNKYAKFVSKIQQTFEDQAHKTNLINELLSRDAGKKYLSGQEPILYLNEYNTEFIKFCVENKLFRPEEIFNYLKYQRLFYDNKKTAEMYELLGIQLKFVANKYGGYRFDPKTIDFIKK